MRALLAFILIGLPASDLQSQGTAPLRIARGDVIGQNEEFGQLTGAALAADGSFYVADYLQSAIFRYSPAGNFLWRSGRKGRGPGEFQLVTNLAALPDGGVLAYDLGSRSLTEFDSGGKYVTTRRLDRSFSRVDGLLAVASGVIVAGVVNDDPAIASFGVHFFSPTFRHVRSVGPLPPVNNPAIRRLWGAGPITLAPNGEILYVRRHPYEIYRYAPDGTQLQLIRVGLPLQGTPDSAYSVSERDGVRSTRPRAGVTHILPALPLSDGRLLTGRTATGGNLLDLLSPSGAVLTAGLVMPAGWDGPVAFDTRRRVLWALGAVDDAPVIFRVQLPEM